MSSIVLSAALAVGAGNPAQQPGGPGPSTQPPVRISAAELELYERAETLINWTPRQIGSFPLLHKLRRAESQSELPAILEQVGKSTVRLFNDFTKIACDEEVHSQTNLRTRLVPGAWIHANDAIHHFHYIITPRPAGGLPMFEEYRTDREGRPVEGTRVAGLWMFTSNFTGEWFYFSPPDQPYNHFRYFGTQTVQKHECYVMGFAQNPHVAHIVTAFGFVDPPAALLLQGLAWIDKQSFQILRITTWLLAPRTDIGLNGENADVNYFSVQPAGLDRVLWVPHDVTVAILFRGALIKNTHRYSKFRLFRVESTIKPAE